MSGNRRDTTAIRQVGEEPPYLDVGTEVSAKYRGAFCEAKIKSVKKLVKCKIMHSKDNGSSTVTDDCVKGELKIGSDVDVKLPDSQEIMSGYLIKITDSSVYTVIFDDGDERTLKRTSLCLKGEKHFNESETLDHLPLTDPENFGTPVMQQGKKARKGRRYSISNDDCDEEEKEDACHIIPARKKLLRSEENMHKVVLVEMTEKKKTFTIPALVISDNNCKHGSPSKNTGHVLVKSFKDGKCFEAHLKDVKDFSKEKALNLNASKGETNALKTAVASAVKFLETKQLPSDWNIEILKHNEEVSKDSSDSSEDEETDPEKDDFMDKLSKFLEDKGTPLQRYPVLGHRDLDLYKLHQIVFQMGGMDKVKSWHDVYVKMDIPVVTTAASYHIKNAYKKYLFDYEQEQLELLAKKNEVKKHDKCSSRLQNTTCSPKTNLQAKIDLKKEIFELNDNRDIKYKGRTRTKGDRCRTKSTSPKPPSPKSLGSPSVSGSAGCPSPSEKPKGVCELAGKASHVDDLTESNSVDGNKSLDVKETDVKVESTLEGVKNCGKDSKNVEILTDEKEEVIEKKECKKEEQEKIKEEDEERDVPIKEENEEVDKREEVERSDSNMSHDGDENAVDVVNSPSGTSNDSVEDDEGSENGKSDKTSDDHGLMYKLNDRIDVRYGRGRNATVYQAKITAVDPKAEEGLFYSVHYYGWNSRHDEWIGNERIIGRGQKLTRTRNGNRPAPKTMTKPPVAAKPVAKKNGKNGNGVEKPVAKPNNGGRGRKRTPSPTTPVKNGRATKSRSERTDSLDLAIEIKPHRVTRQNSASTPVLGTGVSVTETKTEVEKSEEKDKKEYEGQSTSPVESPVTTTSEISANQPPIVTSDNHDPKSSPGEKTEGGEGEEDMPAVEQPPVINADPESAVDPVTVAEEPKKCLKRAHDDEDSETIEAPPMKKTPIDDVIPLEESPPEEIPTQEQQDATTPEQETPENNEGAPDAATFTPDLTCSEQMETNCASPDPYADEFQVHDGYFSSNGREENSTRLKDSSSSLEETKVEKSSGGRRGKGRRDRKARAPSSQSSIEGGDCHNGTNDGTSMTYMVSPTWTPKYNFTEDLDELLKKEESSERIRLLQEKIKDIRKAYGELKSEVATIDRKRRRRQKRKREEELSAEESNTAGSPSRSSPLSTTNASTVGTSSTPLAAAVECR